MCFSDMFVCFCLFVFCLFVCLLACLFVCLLVCLLFSCAFWHHNTCSYRLDTTTLITCVTALAPTDNDATTTTRSLLVAHPKYAALFFFFTPCPCFAVGQEMHNATLSFNSAPHFYPCALFACVFLDTLAASTLSSSDQTAC